MNNGLKYFAAAKLPFVDNLQGYDTGTNDAPLRLIWRIKHMLGPSSFSAGSYHVNAVSSFPPWDKAFHGP